MTIGDFFIKEETVFSGNKGVVFDLAPSNLKAMITERICIYPKDVMLITGRSERSGCRLLQTIKRIYGKAKHQFVTIFEFSEYI